jgi:hypothetical protein
MNRITITPAARAFAIPADASPATSYEVTVGPDPQTFIDQAVRSLESAPLRRMFAAFVTEPEIHTVLTTPVGGGVQYQRTGLCRYAVQVLRSAAETAAYSSAFCGAERDALYVATFIEGCRAYLGACIDGASNVDDVLHTLVMEPLRQLDRQDERLAGLVRMCLGCGLPDEVDDFYVPRLRNTVRRALSRVNAEVNVGQSTGVNRQDRQVLLRAERSASNLSSY